MKRFIIILLCTILLVACSDVGSGSNDSRTVLKIDGHEVTHDEYTYFYMNTLYDFTINDSNFNKIKDNQLLLDTVLSTLVRHYAVYKLADQYDIKYDSEMKKSVDEEIEYTIEVYGGEEEYYAALEENYMTGDCYRKILEINQLEIAVRAYLIDEYTSDIPADDETVEEDFNVNFVRATHIFIDKDNGSTDEENRKLAEELSNRIKNGESFDDLQKEYGQDIGIDYKNGYYLTYGLYNQTFENTAYSLEINEISNAVESSVGFHIVKRLPLDSDYFNKNIEDIRYIYKTRVINERLDEIAKTLEVEYTNLFNEIEEIKGQ